MRDNTTAILGPDRWRSLDEAAWHEYRDTLLCSDQSDPDRNRQILCDGRYQPDTFTIAERAAMPTWLHKSERDYPSWLHGLVTQRVTGMGPSYARHPKAAVAHAVDQVERLLEHPLCGGVVAEHLYNPEAPYTVDRVIAFSILGDVAAELPHHRRYRAIGHALIADLLGRPHRFARLGASSAIRMAIAAGLVGLDVKGGISPCTPIPVADYSTRPDEVAAQVRRLMQRHANRPALVDHTTAFLGALGYGPTRLVWFLDDLIESAFDLLAIQHLLADNPRLTVHVVPKRGKHDNDADADDIHRMKYLPALHALASAVANGRVTISRSGPSMATANPLKFAPDLVARIAAADVVFVKGGRIDEMFSGQLTIPTYTGYVVVREFTESLAGLDARQAPQVLIGTDPGRPAWWGWQGRASRTLTVGPGRCVPACHSTVAEHQQRATNTTPRHTLQELRSLVNRWPNIQARYRHLARHQLRQLHDNLTQHASQLQAEDQRLLSTVDKLLASNDPTGEAS